MRCENACHFFFGGWRSPRCGLPEEAFHVARRLVHHQHARMFGELDESMRHAARQKDRVPCGTHEALITDLKAVLPFQHMEELVLSRMDVKWRATVGTLADLLKYRHAAVGISATHFHIERVRCYALHLEVLAVTRFPGSHLISLGQREHKAFALGEKGQRTGGQRGEQKSFAIHGEGFGKGKIAPESAVHYFNILRQRSIAGARHYQYTPMRILCSFLACTLLAFACSAQAQHHFWPFGFNAGLDFSSGAPVAISTPLSTDEGCTSICDVAGQLLFYSDGENVWDRNNNVMPNGTGLFGSFSSSQSALIVPVPDDPQRFYLFTAPAQAGEWVGQPNAAYSIVDMAANGGNGDVVTANVLLDGPVTERLTATYHANGRDVWVLYHRWESDAYLAYLVTCLGVEGPVVTHIGQAMHGNPDGSGASPIGCMRMNRQGDRLGNTWGRSVPITNSEWLSTAYFEVLDFDNSTGQLSNIRSDSIGGTPELFSRGYGVEFSPNGTLVYMSDQGLVNGNGGYSTIRQYDLTSADPMNNAYVVATENRAFGSLQLAPDGKIYVARLNGATYLSAITNPDVPGPGCGIVNNAVSTGTHPSTWGLPNHWDTYPTSPPDGPIALRDTLLCSGDDAITLDATWAHPFHTPSYLWSTGETSASITVDSSGRYTVEVQLPCSTLVDTVDVRFGGTLFSLGSDRSTCDDVPATLDPGPVSGSMLWSTGDTSRSITVQDAGTYTLWLTDSLGCTSSDAVVVTTRNCRCPLYLPNAFTPNGDGINDRLAVGMDCTPTAFELVVFDRWGRSIHRSTEPSLTWNGDSLPTGVYTYMLSYAWQAQDGERRVRRTGSVTLVR